MENCRPAFTVGVPNTLISLKDSPTEDEDKLKMAKLPYRSRVGQLLWIARTTRPDISYQVNALARVAHNPGKCHWDASSHLIRYISHTRDMGISYHRSSTPIIPGQWKPIIWSDATWATDYGMAYDNYRSTTGWCTTVGDNILSWNSNQQSNTAQSSAESEWYAAADSVKEALYVRNLFKELRIPLHGALKLKCDNQSTIKQSVNAVDQHNSRHIGQRAHFLRHHCHAGAIELEFVPTRDQRADIFTKVLAEKPHVHLRDELNIARLSTFRAI